MPVETLTQAPAPRASLPRSWGKTAGVLLATAAAAYGMIYIDVQARAREAFLQGTRYLSWHKDPEGKRVFLEGKFLKDKAVLDRKKAKGELSAEAYAEDLEVLRFDREQAAAESAVKYAYQWYKDVYELFSPPESKWVRRARFLAPAAKQLWREELKAKNIPFEEYMLDLEPGEEAGTLMVFSTRKRSLADKCVAALKAKNILATVYDGPAHGRLPQEGLKILVPRDAFWPAHEALRGVVDPAVMSDDIIAAPRV